MLDDIYNRTATSLSNPDRVSTDRLFLWCLKTVNSGLELIIEDHLIDKKSTLAYSALCKAFETRMIDTLQLEKELALQIEKRNGFLADDVKMALMGVLLAADENVITPDFFVKHVMGQPTPAISAAMYACKPKARSTTSPDSQTHVPNDATVLNGAPIATDNATVYDGGATVSDDNTVFNNGATVPDNTTVLSGGATVPDSHLTVPNSGETAPDTSGVSAAAVSYDATTSENGIATSLDWDAGDVVLDLYEVLPVNKDGKTFHAGGFGKVYKAHHKTWATELSVKVPHADKFRTESQKQMFIRECETWINLGLHPHIVSCYYVRDIGGVPSVFAEWMDGGSLNDAIRSEWLYDGEPKQVMIRILNIAIQFARGLLYAHENGLIHQDVKPDNLMLTKDGSAKVSDFGIARAHGIASTETATEGGSTVLAKEGGFTPAYRSPEQQTGATLTRRTDIWSWAVSVLEMFVGERTWGSGIAAGLECDFYLADARITPPDEMVDLLRCCFKENEAERPHDFAEIEQALLKIFEAQAGRPYWQPRPKAAADTADSLNNKALSYLDIGKQDEAEKCWEKAISLAPDHVESVYNQMLHSIRTTTVSKKEHIVQMTRFAKQNPGWKSQYFLAKIYMEYEEYLDAIPYLQNALEDEPDNQDITSAMSICKDRKSVSTPIRVFGEKARPNRINKPFLLFLNRTTHCISVDLRGLVLKRWEVDSGLCVCTYSGHNGRITAMALSSDDQLLTSAGEDHTLRIWNMQSGQCKRSLNMQFTPLELIFSPTKRYILVYAPKKLELYDLVENSSQLLPTGAGNIYEYRFSKDDNHIYIRTDRKKMVLHLTNGRLSQSTTPFSSDNKVSPKSHDDRLVLKGIGENTLELWNEQTKQCIQKISGFSSKIKNAYFDGNDKYIITHDLIKTKSRYRVWETYTGRCAATIVDKKQPEILISRNRHLARFFFQTQDVLWDLKKNRMVLSWRQESLLFRSDGETYIQYGYRNASWYVRLLKLPTYSKPSEWALCKISTSEEVLHKEEVIDNIERQILKAVANDDIRHAQNLLAQAIELPTFALSPKHLFLHNLIGRYCRTMGFNGFKPVDMFGSVPYPMSTASKRGEDIISVLFSHDSQYVYCHKINRLAMIKNKIDVYDISQKSIVHTFVDNIKHFCISPTSHMTLYYCRCDDMTRRKTISFCKLCHFPLNEEHIIKWPEADIIHQLQFSPDGQTVAIGYNKSSVLLWSVEKKTVVREFKQPKKSSSEVFHIRFSPDGKRLIGVCPSKMIVWSVSNGRITRRHPLDYTGYINCLSISPDGQTIIAGQSKEKSFKRWDIETGRCLNSYTGHQSAVESTVFNADGRFILSISLDGTLRIWRTHNGECLHTIEGFYMYAVQKQTMRHNIDGSLLFVKGYRLKSNTVQNKGDIWDILWDYEFPGWTDWDEGARPYLEIFLSLHPKYTGDDFNILIEELQNRGYGWLRPEGVLAKLTEIKNRRG